MRRFEGRVALVTGGRSGIGGAIAQRLASEGARVFTAQRGADPLREWVEADLADPASPARVVAEVMTRAGRLDVLVNNAGVMQQARADIVIGLIRNGHSCFYVWFGFRVQVDVAAALGRLITNAVQQDADRSHSEVRRRMVESGNDVNLADIVSGYAGFKARTRRRTAGCKHRQLRGSMTVLQGGSRCFFQ